jgi:oxaloacetate decarboxylase gamma subunit
MQPSLLDQGVSLMLVGMGTVFVFLTLLVMAMSVMAGIIKRFSHVPADVVSEEEVAVIAAAIALHRKQNS